MHFVHEFASHVGCIVGLPSCDKELIALDVITLLRRASVGGVLYCISQLLGHTKWQSEAVRGHLLLKSLLYMLEYATDVEYEKQRNFSSK